MFIKITEQDTIIYYELRDTYSKLIKIITLITLNIITQYNSIIITNIK